MQPVNDDGKLNEYSFSYVGLGRSVSGRFYRKEEVDQRITELERIIQLEQQVSHLKIKPDILKQKIKGLETDKRTLTAERDELDQRITELESQLSGKTFYCVNCEESGKRIAELEATRVPDELLELVVHKLEVSEQYTASEVEALLDIIAKRKER